MKRAFALISIMLLICTLSFADTIKTKVYKSVPYNRVAIIGSYCIQLDQRKSQYITIKGKQSVIQRIKVSVKEGLLVIEMTKIRDKRMRVKSEDLPVVLLPINQVSHIDLDGYTNVTSRSPITTSDLEINISGASKMNIGIICNYLNLIASGASYININGRCKNLDLTMNGAGLFDGFNFKAATSTIHINGSGKSRLNVKDMISGNISGFGTLYYKGSPKMNVTKNIGLIKQMP